MNDVKIYAYEVLFLNKKWFLYRFCINNLLYNGTSVYDTMSHLSPLCSKSYSQLLNISKMKIDRNKICNLYVHGKHCYRNC